MSASLVGSEMCIRDSADAFSKLLQAARNGAEDAAVHAVLLRKRCPRRRPVSYTHLTLPTICSV
eukprot:4607801-Alexandrium_andersonii.AAC.1